VHTLERRTITAPAKGSPEDRIPIDNRLPGLLQHSRLDMLIEQTDDLDDIHPAPGGKLMIEKHPLLKGGERIAFLDIGSVHGPCFR
jgi:hypothetical protein